MHRTNTSTVPSVISELQTLLRCVLAWYDTLVRLVRILIQIAYQSTVPVPSKKARTVLVYCTI